MGSQTPPSNPRKDLIVTQLSFGNFPPTTTAKDLTDFLEINAGLIWRCRLKTSWTPPESFPDFSVPDPSSLPRHDPLARVPVPHAFAHFALPAAARRALSAAGRNDLVLSGCVLRALSSADSSTRAERRRNVDPFRFPSSALHVGTLASPSVFISAWHDPAVDFVVDPFDGCCRILFSKDTAFAVKDSKVKVAIKCDFKIEFLLRDVNEIRVSMDRAPFTLIFQLGAVPLISYRTADDDIYVSVSFSLLDDEDPWIRTTDFTPSGAIGRCGCYRVSMPTRFGPKLKRALDYMRERRVAEYWPKHEIAVRDEPGFGAPVTDPFFCVQYEEGIPFATLFMLNAVVHKGIISQYQLTKQFYDLLRGQCDLVNDIALRHICSYKRPVFDACGRLKLVQEWLLRTPKLLKRPALSDDNVEVRRLVITPTKAHCLPPEVELSNRVLRKFKHVSDRFLRVTFMDEGMQTLNNGVLSLFVAPIVRESNGNLNTFLQKTNVFRRVKKIMTTGFYLCGRQYNFLAFSSNQLRDRSAWFFAEDKVPNGTTASSIRMWMGKFKNRNVAKCAARIGQCFSSTYATVEVLPTEVNPDLEDVARNGYCFSDGIGKITPELAVQVAAKLQLTESPPSAYQIRYAGYKGVVAVWPGGDDGMQLLLRESMNKFMSSHTVLEVVSWTRFQPGFLNRQIVTLLSSLGVPDDVFDRMQESMIFKLNKMLVDTDVAFEILSTSCAEQGNVAAMMLSAGFTPQTEPHLNEMLACIRSSQLGDLSAKSRIFVQKGRWLMGCLDELGVLEQGQCFVQASTPSLEKCFMKHGSRFSGPKENRKVVVGTVVVAKNPCLHPGDVRVLEAVDVPSLHHLADCLVFPQKGDRPHSHEASGSDLDGDLYFVTWDENLIPPGKRSWPPMAYTTPEVKLQPRDVTNEDIIEFFCRHIVNENLGVICNAHVVHADISEYGAMDENCLKLAELAAIAVDVPKTGKIVTMPQDLRPKLYPDFMDKEHYRSYKSEKILGRLYRKIKDASHEDEPSELSSTSEDLPYDMDLDIPGAGDYLAEAWDSKCTYDRQLNALLGQYRVRKEGEVVTGHVFSLSKHNSRKQGELKERLKNAYYALHKEFRRLFEAMGPDFNQLTDEERCVLYERKASAWYQVTYHPKYVKESLEMKEPESEHLPAARLSFPWIATDYLVRIKVRCRKKGIVKGGKPIDSLANYLSERMFI